jgi:hypothetical protein
VQLQAINVAVGALERRGDQHAAAQAFRVAERRHVDVDRLPRLREGRQRGRDHHRGHVLGLQLHARRHGHAHLRQHRRQALRRERRALALVARAVEADDEAVADERVAAHALHGGNFLDARCRVCRPPHGGAGHEGRQRNRGTHNAFNHRVIHIGITLKKKRDSRPITCASAC